MSSTHPTPTSSPADKSKQPITIGVAVAIALISIAEGGYSVELRAVVGILAWGTVAIGLSFGAFPRSPTPRPALICGALLAGLALLTLVSVSWASDNGTAVEEFLRVSAYLGVFALAVCLSGPDRRPWLKGLALGILAVGVLAVLGRLIPGLPGGDEEIREFLPAARGRLSYPIGYWNGLAALFALGIVLLVWLSAAARTITARALALAGVPILGLGMYLTASRSSFGALVIGLLALIAIGPRRIPLIGGAAIAGLGVGFVALLASGQTELLDDVATSEAESQGLKVLGALLACMFFTGLLRVVTDGLLSGISVPLRVGRAAAALVALVAVAIAIAADPAARLDDFKEPPEAPEGEGFVAAHLGSGNGSGRWQFWGEALDAFGSEPLRGIGAGGYESYWNQHAPIDQVTAQAHSLYLEQLAELGPLALLLILAFLGIGAACGFSQRSRYPEGEAGAALALLATGAVSAGAEWTWEIPAVFGPVVLVVALLTGPASAGGTAGEATPRESRFGWGMATILVGWVSVFLAFGSLLAERDLEASRDAVGDRDLERAAEEARQAIAIQGWAAEPRLQLALVQEQAGDLEAAATTLDEAIDRAPEDWRLWLVQARLATVAGDLAAARSSLREARRLNPRSPLFSDIPDT